MFAGLAASTMSRDDSWRFYLLGRSVERVDMIVRLLHVAGVGPGVVAGLGDGAALAPAPHDTYLRTYRGALDAGAGGAVPAAGPAVPALGVPRAAAGRVVPGGAGQPADGADRGEGRGAAAARPGPQRAGVPAAGRPARRPAGPAAWACRRPSATSARPCRSSTSTRRRGSRGPHRRWSDMGWRIRIVHTTGYSYESPVRPVVQRGAADPAQRPPAERDRQPGGDHPGHPLVPLHRLLGHHGHGVRPARPAHRAGGRRRRRWWRPADPIQPVRTATLGRPAPATTCATGTRRCWSSPTTSARTRELAKAARALRKRGTTPVERGARRLPLGARAARPTSPARTGVHTSAVEAWEAAQGRLPGLRAPDAAAAARDGHPGAVRVGLPAAEEGRRGAGDGARGRATPGSRRGPAGWWGYDPTNDMRDRPPARVGGGGPRLRRRAAAEGHLLGRHRGSALDVTVDMTRLA